jgi:hypothetical protein
MGLVDSRFWSTENSREKNSSSQFERVLDWRNVGTSSLTPTAASYIHLRRVSKVLFTGKQNCRR